MQKTNDDSFFMNTYLLHKLSTPTSVLFSLSDFITQNSQISPTHRDLVIARSTSLEIYSNHDGSYALSFTIPLNARITALETVQIYDSQPKSLVFTLEDQQCYIVHNISNDFETVFKFSTKVNNGPVSAQFGPFLRTDSYNKLLILHTTQGFLHVVNLRLSVKSGTNHTDLKAKHHYFSIPFWDVRSIDVTRLKSNSKNNTIFAVHFIKPNKASVLRLYGLEQNSHLQLSFSDLVSLSHPNSFFVPISHANSGFLVFDSSKMRYFTIKNTFSKGHKNMKDRFSKPTLKVNLEHTIELLNKDYITYYSYYENNTFHVILGSSDRSLHCFTLKKTHPGIVITKEMQLTLDVTFNHLVYCNSTTIFACNNNGESALLYIDLQSKRHSILKRFESLGPILDFTQCLNGNPFYTCSANGDESTITKVSTGIIMETFNSIQCHSKAQAVWFDTTSQCLVLSYFDRTELISLSETHPNLKLSFTESSTLAYADFTSYHIQVTPHALFRADYPTGVVEKVNAEFVHAFITNQFVCVSTYSKVFLYTHELRLVFEYTKYENIYDILCNDKYLVISFWQSIDQVIFCISDLVAQINNFSVLKNPDPFAVIPIKFRSGLDILNPLLLKSNIKDSQLIKPRLLSSTIGTQNLITFIVRYFSDSTVNVIHLNDNLPKSRILAFARRSHRILNVPSRLPLKPVYIDGFVYLLGDTNYRLDLAKMVSSGLPEMKSIEVTEDVSLTLSCPTFCQSIKTNYDENSQSVYIFGNNTGDLVLTNSGHKGLIYKQKIFSGAITKIASSPEPDFVLSLSTCMSNKGSTQSVNVHESNTLEILETVIFNQYESPIDKGLFQPDFFPDTHLHFLVICELSDPAKPDFKASVSYCVFNRFILKTKVIAKEYLPEVPIHLEIDEKIFTGINWEYSNSERLLFNLYWSDRMRSYSLINKKMISLTNYMFYESMDYTKPTTYGHNILDGTFTSQSFLSIAVLNNSGRRQVLESRMATDEETMFLNRNEVEFTILPNFIYEYISEPITKVIFLDKNFSLTRNLTHLLPRALLASKSGALYIFFSVSLKSSLLKNLLDSDSLMTVHIDKSDIFGGVPCSGLIDGRKLAAADAGVFDNEQVETLLNEKFSGSFIKYFELDAL